MAWLAGAFALGTAAVNANSKKTSGVNAGLPGFSQDARTSEFVFDNSGWNVSFGNDSPITSEATKTTDLSGAAPSASGVPLLGTSLAGAASDPTFVYAAVAGLALIIWKRKKS